MRLSVLALLAPIVIAGTAAAEPSFEVIDHGAALEVIARDMTATSTKITPIRSRLELPLDGKPRVGRLRPKDATAIAVELDGTSPRRLSIKLGHSRETVAGLAAHARAVQVGADLHVLIPRKVPAPGAAIELPAPTVPVVAPTPATTDAAPIAPTPPSPAAAPATTEATPALAAAPPATAPTTSPTLAKPPAAAPRSESPWSRFSMIAALGLAGIGCIGWLIRKKRNAPGTSSTIDVIAQRSLGGKARVVWLTAGPRELIVAVTPQQVRVLGQWKTGEAPQALPRAQLAGALADEPSEVRTARASSESIPPRATSAVSGLLKLRASSGPSAASLVNAEVATDDVDADALWAREILAASAGARR